MTEFYDHPELYDALLPARAEVPFYVGLAREQGGDVLALACGTGQLAIPVAAAGLPTVGLDLSREMLRVAEQRASAGGVPVSFVSADMRSFNLEREFALIFIARNALLHLLTTADLMALFATVRRHLTPGGLFAFDIFNPSVSRLARQQGQRVPVMKVSTPRFGLLTVDETAVYDSAAQVTTATWYISSDAQQDAWIVPLVLRSIFPQELPLLLSAAGLELIDRFGELSREPFRDGSRIQACLCRRRG